MKNKFSLLQYSAAAVALIGATAASSQVIYTNVDPDVVLDEPDEMFGIDLDDDGLNDFNFFNESYSGTVFYMDIGNVKALLVGAFDSIQNGLIGNTAYLSGAGGYTYFQPSALDSEVVINSFNLFLNNNYQTLAKTIYKSGYFPTTFNWGYWNSYFWGEQIEKFLGFRFTDEESIQRYGWIRCSVIDSGRTLIIHDYAYELQPEHPIISGDTLSYVDINSTENTLDATVYSFHKSIYIHLNNLSSTQLIISDIAGRELIKKAISNESEVVNMNNYATGIYLVKLIQKDRQLVKTQIIE